MIGEGERGDGDFSGWMDGVGAVECGAVSQPLKEKSGDETRAVLVALLPTWLAIAWLVSRAQWFWNNRPDMQFGWLVLALSAFVVWDGWEKRPRMEPRLRWPVLLLGAGGCAVLFLSQIYMAAFGMMPAALMGMTVCGFLPVIFANLLYVFGWPGVKHFAFAFLFLLIALPLPSALHNPIVNGLQAKVARVNVEVLNLAGIPAQQIGSLIHLPNGTVGVDEACSGIRSLQSTVMATLFIGYLMLKSRSLQFWLLVSGVALAIVGNLGRSLYLSFTANARGLESINEVHDTAGWSILIFTAVGVAGLAWAFSKLEKAAEKYRTLPEEATAQ